MLRTEVCVWFVHICAHNMNCMYTTKAYLWDSARGRGTCWRPSPRSLWSLAARSPRSPASKSKFNFIQFFWSWHITFFLQSPEGQYLTDISPGLVQLLHQRLTTHLAPPRLRLPRTRERHRRARPGWTGPRPRWPGPSARTQARKQNSWRLRIWCASRPPPVMSPRRWRCPPTRAAMIEAELWLSDPVSDVRVGDPILLWLSHYLSGTIRFVGAADAM